MATFKTTSAIAALATTRGAYSVSQVQSDLAPPTSAGQGNKRRRKGRGKNREVSLEMFSNYTGEDLPSPYQLAAEGNLEDLKAFIENLGATIKEKDENGASLLHHAAANNQVGVMQYLIDSGIDLNLVDKDGNTALHLASEKSHVEAVHLLLSSGASDTIVNKAMDAPLHLIMRNNQIDVLAAFLQYSIDILVKGYRQRTPLHLAAEKDNLEVCEILHNSVLAYDEYKKIAGFRLCAPDEDDLTPIHLAARNGSHRVLKFMISKALEHGYSPEKILSFLDEENSTPLHAAVDAGHTQVVEVLLEHKASPTACDGKQLPPFLLASTQGKLSMMQLMVHHCGKEIVSCRDLYGQTALHRCARAINSAEIISFLAENGAEVDSIDDEGRTPLMATIKCGSLTGMKALLSKGASIFIKDKMGFNALHYAVKHKRKFILSCLLKLPNASELVTDCDKNGSSPIHYALNLCQNSMVALMVTSAASQFKNVKDVNGNNYLHLAAGSGDWKALSILLEIPECLLLLNETNKYGGTPLHFAAGRGHLRAVEILLSNGAMVHRCHTGNTPFMYACIKGKPDVAKVMYEAHPFQISWTNDNGDNALHLGAKSGCPVMITLLLDIGVPVTLNHNGETFFDIIINEHLVKCAKAVIDHERWQECLDVVAPDKEHPMILLIQRMPEVAKMILDRSHTKASLATEDCAYWESHDFKYIRLMNEHSSEEEQGVHEPSDSEKTRLMEDDQSYMDAPAIKYKGSSLKSGLSPKYRQKTATGHLNVLKKMVQFNRIPLLTHPVTESYLKSKWRQYGRWIHLFATSLFFFQIIFLILFIFLAPRAVDVRRSEEIDCESSNITAGNCSSTTTIQFSFATNVARFITIGFTTLNFVQWLLTVFKMGLVQSLNISQNAFVLVDLMAVISTFIFTIPWTTGGFQTAIWEAGALASFFTWFSLVLKIQLFDLFGVYITMFLAITRTVLQVLLICFLFIIAFAMSLYILAGNVEDFSTIGFSLFTNFAHLLGEIDYASFVAKDISGELFFSTLTFMFVIIIAIIMAIVIQNLLIGLAVGDIEQIKLNAIAEKRTIEIGFYSRIDNIMPKRLLWKLDKGAYKFFPNKKVFWARSIWRYIWKLLKGQDARIGEDDADFSTSGSSGRGVDHELASINLRIDELAVTQEKLIDMLVQIQATLQQQTKLDSSDGDVVENSQ